MLALALEEHPLPPALQNDATISVASLEGGGAIAGGKAGLFEIASGSMNAIDTNAVAGMTTILGTGVAVANQGGLQIYTGTLQPSGLDLMGAKPNALASRTSAIWIGTDRDLFLLDSSELSSFADQNGITRVLASDAASEVILESASQRAAMKIDGTAYSVHSLSAEIDATTIVPDGEGRLFALGSGQNLEVRVSAGSGRALWRPYALTIDPRDQGARGVAAIAVDPTSGDVFAIQGSTLFRISKDVVATYSLPTAMGTVIALSVTRDGSVWTSDGTTLRAFKPMSM
jgi:hypothetical protein